MTRFVEHGRADDFVKHFHELCGRFDVNWNCTGHYDVAEIQGKSVTDHQ